MTFQIPQTEPGFGWHKDHSPTTKPAATKHRRWINIRYQRKCIRRWESLLVEFSWRAQLVTWRPAVGAEADAIGLLHLQYSITAVISLYLAQH